MEEISHNKSVTFRISPEAHKRLLVMSNKHERSMNQLLNMILLGRIKMDEVKK